MMTMMMMVVVVSSSSSTIRWISTLPENSQAVVGRSPSLLGWLIASSAHFSRHTAQAFDCVHTPTLVGT